MTSSKSLVSRFEPECEADIDSDWHAGRYWGGQYYVEMARHCKPLHERAVSSHFSPRGWVDVEVVRLSKPSSLYDTLVGQVRSHSVNLQCIVQQMSHALGGGARFSVGDGAVMFMAHVPDCAPAVGEDVRAFCDEHNLMNYLIKARDYVVKYFGSTVSVTFALDTDPESGEKWVAVSVAAAHTVDSARVAYKKFSAAWTNDVPVHQRHMIRLSLSLA